MLPSLLIPRRLLCALGAFALGEAAATPSSAIATFCDCDCQPATAAARVLKPGAPSGNAGTISFAQVQEAFASRTPALADARDTPVRCSQPGASGGAAAAFVPGGDVAVFADAAVAFYARLTARTEPSRDQLKRDLTRFVRTTAAAPGRATARGFAGCSSRTVEARLAAALRVPALSLAAVPSGLRAAALDALTGDDGSLQSDALLAAGMARPSGEASTALAAAAAGRAPPVREFEVRRRAVGAFFELLWEQADRIAELAARGETGSGPSGGGGTLALGLEVSVSAPGATGSVVELDVARALGCAAEATVVPALGLAPAGSVLYTPGVLRSRRAEWATFYARHSAGLERPVSADEVARAIEGAGDPLLKEAVSLMGRGFPAFAVSFA